LKYIYGPVPSRRLGKSVGVDPLPPKTCNFQCIYCQLGRTTNFTNERQNFFPKKEICIEIEEAINKYEKELDYITFVGSGEPTLYKDLGDLIKKVKEITVKPICVITNGSLLQVKEVREALKLANVVLPTLDAGDERSFIKINRPHPSIKYDKMLRGFMEFKQEFSGKFWIEIMLMKNINDSEEELKKIRDKLKLIEPDRIDINVPIRPPTESWVEIPDKSVFSLLNEIFGDFNDLNFPEIGHFGKYSANFEKEFLKIIERHPMRQDQIIQTFKNNNLSETEIKNKLDKLYSDGKINKLEYNGKIFWRLNTRKN